MNIFELTKMHKRKQQNKIKVYDELLSKCHKKIYQICNGNNVSECLYKVPVYTFGSPLYNQEAAIAYIMLKLRKNGFDVVYEKPNIIRVSWDKHKQTYFYDQDVLLLENEPYRAKDILKKLNKQPEGSQFKRKPLQYQQQPQQRQQSPQYQPRSHSSSSSSYPRQPPQYQQPQQQQIEYTSPAFQQTSYTPQAPQQITYNPQQQYKSSTNTQHDTDNANTNSVESMSYMTKYFKDLNQKYLTE
jgi:hypothetical protein